MKKNIVFIVNPISGKGKGEFIAPEIKLFFESLPHKIKIIFAEYAGHAKEIVKDEVLTKPDIIVACGGDGTINEVAQGLLGSDIPLGIIPIGSGNGLASNLNVPKDVQLALKNLLSNNVETIDVGKINERYFFSNVGLGIDACVIKRYTEKKQRNFIGYLKASVWGFVNYKPVNFSIDFDNEEEEDDYFFVFCSNSDEAGYGISFTPKAKLNDGLLDVVCVEKLNFLELISFSYSVLTNQIGKFRKAKVKQVERVVFKSKEKSLNLQIDGESVIFETSVVEVSVLSNSLKIISGK